MNLTGLALTAYVPTWIKREKLNSLIKATSKAFSAAPPDLDHRSFEECLEAFAVFTRDEIERRIQRGDDLQEVKEALYRYAYDMGNELREQLNLRSRRDVLSIGSALYRAIGIDFEGSSSGSVVIRSCFFSRYYSDAVCRVMSSLDEGIAAGLSDGGTMRFSERITEGKTCCVASFDFRDEAV